MLSRMHIGVKLGAHYLLGHQWSKTCFGGRVERQPDSDWQPQKATKKRQNRGETVQKSFFPETTIKNDITP